VWETIFTGFIKVKYKSEVTCAEIGMKTEDLEFSVEDGADKLAENAQSQKIMKIGRDVRNIFMRLAMKFHIFLTPEKCESDIRKYLIKITVRYSFQWPNGVETEILKFRWTRYVKPSQPVKFELKRTFRELRRKISDFKLPGDE